MCIILYNPELHQLAKNDSKFSDSNVSAVFINNGPKLNIQLNSPVIDLGENKGISGAQNIGSKYLMDKGIDYIFFLDQDTRFDASFFKKMLLEFFDIKNIDNSIGILSPKIFDLDTEIDVGIHKIEIDNISKVYLNGRVKNTLPISSGILVDCEVLKKTHGVKDNLFIDWVDFELDLNAMVHGFSIYSTNIASLRHKIGRPTTKKFFLKKLHPYNYPLVREYYFSRNAIFILRRYGNRFKGLKKFVNKALLYRIVTVPYENQKIQRIWVIIRGVWDGNHFDKNTSR